MKKSATSTAGKKMLTHDRDLGPVDHVDLDERSQEIARIEGHAVSSEDRKQAKRELAGDDLPPTTDEDAESIGSLSRDPSEPVANTGRQVSNQEEESGQSAIERLVSDGVNEAEHEQMLAARRQRKA